MTVDTPLTCYICGETTDRATVDMLGCFVDQGAAHRRFEEKHGHEPGGFLDVCPECKHENPNHAKNAERKYDVHGSKV